MWIIYVFDDSCHYILRQGLCLLSHGITGRCWVLGIQTEVLMHAQQVLYPRSFSPSTPKYFANKYVFWTALFVFAWCTIWMLESGSEHSGTLSCRLPTTSGPAKLPSSLLPCIFSQVDVLELYSLIMSVPDCPSLCYWELWRLLWISSLFVPCFAPVFHNFCQKVTTLKVFPN